MTGNMPDHLEAIDDLYAISTILGSMWCLDQELGNVAGLSEAMGFLSRVIDNRTDILKFYVDNGYNKSDELEDTDEDDDEDIEENDSES